MEQALELARPEDVIIVTGSFYVISEAMEWDCHCK
jgi:folylpolyglutamate synthase/dihydropteroate synthase